MRKSRITKLNVIASLLMGLGLSFHFYGRLYHYSFLAIAVGLIIFAFSIFGWGTRFIICFLMISFIAYQCYNSINTPERYLISENYRGPVIIVYNQLKGQAPEFDGKRRLYRIPSTGILFTQFHDEQGLINQDYYYVSPSGSRRRLGVLDTHQFNENFTLEKNLTEPSRDSLAVFDPVSVGNLQSSVVQDRLIVTELWVGAYRNLNFDKDYPTKQIDSLLLLLR